MSRSPPAMVLLNASESVQPELLPFVLLPAALCCNMQGTKRMQMLGYLHPEKRNKMEMVTMHSTAIPG